MIYAAVRALNGGNTQTWEFAVVNDPLGFPRLERLTRFRLRTWSQDDSSDH